MSRTGRGHRSKTGKVCNCCGSGQSSKARRCDQVSLNFGSNLAGGCSQRRLRESGQWAKWNFCLSAARIAADQERA
jgi:hypothetical protein